MKKEQILKFYQTYRLYIFPAIVAVSSIFLIIFAIYPQTVKVMTNQKSQGALDTKVKFLESKVSALESYDADDLSQKVTAALSAYPPEKDYATILGLLQQLAAGSGFTINSVSLGNTLSGSGAEGFSVKIDLSGSKNFLNTLFTNLENSPRILRITSIEASVSKTSGMIDVSLNLDVPFSSTPQNAGTADTPLPELSQKENEILEQLAKISAQLPKSVSSSTRGKANPFE